MVSLRSNRNPTKRKKKKKEEENEAEDSLIYKQRKVHFRAGLNDQKETEKNPSCPVL